MGSRVFEGCIHVSAKVEVYNICKISARYDTPSDTMSEWSKEFDLNYMFISNPERGVSSNLTRVLFSFFFASPTC